MRNGNAYQGRCFCAAGQLSRLPTADGLPKLREPIELRE